MLTEEAVEKIFTITLNEAVAVDLILDVVFSGTADEGTDYSAPATVTIPAMQTSVGYTVTVIEDVVAEFDETVMLSISGGTAGAARDSFSLASPQNAEFTITNDDIVTVTLAGPCFGDQRVHRHADRYYAEHTVTAKFKFATTVHLGDLARFKL